MSTRGLKPSPYRVFLHECGRYPPSHCSQRTAAAQLPPLAFNPPHRLSTPLTQIEAMHRRGSSRGRLAARPPQHAVDVEPLAAPGRRRRGGVDLDARCRQAVVRGLESRSRPERRRAGVPGGHGDLGRATEKLTVTTDSGGLHFDLHSKVVQTAEGGAG